MVPLSARLPCRCSARSTVPAGIIQQDITQMQAILAVLTLDPAHSAEKIQYELRLLDDQIFEPSFHVGGRRYLIRILIAVDE